MLNLPSKLWLNKIFIYTDLQIKSSKSSMAVSGWSTLAWSTLVLANTFWKMDTASNKLLYCLPRQQSWHWCPQQPSSFEVILNQQTVVSFPLFRKKFYHLNGIKCWCVIRFLALTQSFPYYTWHLSFFSSHSKTNDKLRAINSSYSKLHAQAEQQAFIQTNIPQVINFHHAVRFCKLVPWFFHQRPPEM